MAGSHVAALQLQRGGHVRVTGLLGRDRVERVREGLVLDLGQRCGAARGIAGFGNNGKERLTEKLNLFRREDRLVMKPGRADIVHTGNVAGGQDAEDPGGRFDIREIEA